MDDSLKSVFSESTLSASGIRTLVEALPQLDASRRDYAANETILQEGELNDCLVILMEGRARLIKDDEKGRPLVVDTFGPGALLGLTSFWGKTEVFASVQADTDLVCVSIDRVLFDSLTSENPDFVRAVQGLFVRNLSDRYRNMVRAQVAREKLSAQLEQERNHLRDALKRLEETTNRMVNQEKLATMGQLLAGIAHEINNPVGALLRGIESAKEALEHAFDANGKDSLEYTLLSEGWNCPYWSPEEKRARMSSALSDFPQLGRPLARRVAQLTDAAYNLLRKPIKKNAKELDRLLSVYELGVCFRAVRLSGGRIGKIITSLRNYGKQGGSESEECDLSEGIRDTLTVLNNRLKRYELKLDLAQLPPLSCNLGEINQVWTNLLANAMDATEEGGEICVSASVEGDDILVCIEDSGTGIDPSKLEKVFEANFTTKNSSGSFGLGLGLSISRDIVEKHGGTLRASNRSGGGARFEARFPLGR
ncbi:cyclic nucleotide-binding domain-containing protein [Pelagicoccus sp. NFK12]|uniref:histidine kinase n=1 Tax=Pelagicoccus enzymogenes TaxID=2773457 RepID=A0A927IJM9_9BACT|nr:ATP-binding protein [Pelagicoccus enzymogenes]MBD5781710.1 cyclic nucleotide-binding domain-containing protein [Pelagicoccus enzymogenes]